ncbi:hypothetical protein F5Y04DRAFT_256678 [Hypomontagnella monticulosa]|nr:hypothetical protein F5Y04DRAFT_256678 [Hypomontagnella monticulosa]
MQSADNERNFLRVVVDPPDAEIDFIAIHGLNPKNSSNHAEKTWTSRNGVKWLEDKRFLPAEFPKARVLLFGYNSSVAIESSPAGVREQVNNLLNHLERVRSSDLNRPLVFMCHSLGGLIAKRALVTAKLKAEHNPTYMSTRGIVFFGTPHWGSRLAETGGTVAKIVRFFRGEARNNFVDVLRENSLLTEEMRDTFRYIQDEFSFLSFYETKKVKLGGRNWDFIVTKESATLGASNEEVFPREEDHSGVCTYEESDRDSAFMQLIFNIKRVINRPISRVNPFALVLTAGSNALVQWGFPGQDIANISGGGRNIVTWMTAKSKDASLFDFHDIRYEDILRKGIIEPAWLHNNWGQSIRLLKNGRVETFQTTPKVDLDVFTWLMVLIYSALNASLSDSHCYDVMFDFVVGILQTGSEEYLYAELPSHIEGWNSIASVRMINDATQEEWNRMGREGTHCVGFIPKAEHQDILDFLIWLATKNSSSNGDASQYTTTSKDIYCLAKVLRRIGILSLHAVDVQGTTNQEFDENQLVVKLNKASTHIPNGLENPASIRRGMEIPLDNMRVALSSWPLLGSPNILLEHFSLGQELGRDLKFALYPGYSEYVYIISSRTTQKSTLSHRPLRKGPGNIEDYFLLPTVHLHNALTDLFPNWESIDVEEVFGNSNMFARLQSFVLGYYYGALGQLVVDEQLKTKVALGYWGWWDRELFTTIKCRAEVPTRKYPRRHSIIMLIAYLFAGADLELASRLDHRATGVVAKRTLLTASMLGRANNSENAAKLFLLDMDRSCIPNKLGVVLSSREALEVTSEVVSPDMLRHFPNKFEDFQDILRDQQDDFTIHIEPDWKVDPQTCLVVYRYNGRVVQRLSAADCDAAAIFWRPQTRRDWLIDGRMMGFASDPPLDYPKVTAYPELFSKAYVVPFSKFFGGRVPIAYDHRIPIFVPTQNSPKARVCIKAMFYSALCPNIPHYLEKTYELPPDLKDAIVAHGKDGALIIIP